MSAKSLTELFSPATFASYRIWDSYYLPRLPSTPGGVMEVIERDLRELEPFCLERLCAYLHVGLGTLTAVAGSAAEEPEQIRRILNRWPDRVLGIIHLNANQVAPSLRALDEWIAHGRAVGVCFKSAAPGALVCTHPNFDPLVQRCGELGAVIMQHTWFKTHGKGDPGESTPAELAILARRHPQVTFVCAHAGGEWEKGLRAVRDCGNVLVETSGFDPTAGFIEMAMRELGAERIVFGGHFMSRSAGTELGKIIGANITAAERELIFGGNLRRLLARLRR